MPPPVTPFSSVIAGFNGYIDPHLYGAKGDMVQYTDLVTYAGNQVGTPSGHVFTDADVGKLFYSDIGGSPRTITAVDKVVNRITVSGAAITSGQTDKFGFWGTDDTAALRAALSAAKIGLGGGINGGAGAGTKNINYGRAVKLRTGARYLVRNTAADYNGGAGLTAALNIPRRCALIGGGVGPAQSVISVAPDSYGHGVANEQTLAFDDYNTIANLTIEGFKGLGSANGLDGLYLYIAFNGYSNVDAWTNVFDVTVQGFKRNGVYINGRGEGVFRNVRANSNGQYGFHIERSMDSKWIECNAGGNSKTGFRVEATSSAMFAQCKSYYNGSAGGTSYADCANWHIVSDDGKNAAGIYTSCESQESRGSGFVFEGAGLVVLNGCTASMFGRTAQGSGTRPDICSGYHFKDGIVPAQHITVANCRLDGGTYFADWGYGTNGVHLDAGTTGVHGNFEIGPYAPYSSSLNIAPNSYGPVGGAGATNGLNTRLRVNGVALT